jgi:hypothetical protein
MSDENTGHVTADPVAAPGAPHAPGAAPDDADELERLRAEVAALRGHVARRSRRRGLGLALRRLAAAILVAVAGWLAVLSVVGVWGARTALDTDRWVATVAPLPENPEFNAAVATYLSTEVFEALNVEQRLRQALPEQVTFLAGPVTDAVRDYLRDTVVRFMGTERFQELWESANRFAHAQIVAVLEGRSETVSVDGSTVTLNLLPIVNDLLTAIEQRLPTMFGRDLDLPALGSGEIPAGLHDRIEAALGVSLPDDFAQITLYNRDRLGQLQEVVVMVKRLVAVTVAGALVSLALALWVSPNRRRTVLQFGLWLLIATFVLTRVLRAVRDDLLGQIPEGLYREGASVALYQIFTTLRERGDQLLWLGAGLAVIAYLVGPGRLPVALRRYTARGTRAALSGARTAATSTSLRTFVARYLDILRIGGVAVAAVAALLLSSWLGLLVVAILLAGYEVLVTLLARGGESDAEEVSAAEPDGVHGAALLGPRS